MGSMCSGYGGLELGLAAAGWPLHTAWHAESNPDASAVLAQRWPGVPNHGDITAIDWTTVAPVDVLCAGFPCQDISNAGKRAGIEKGTRSGIWFNVADAIRVLRPRIVILENVAALLSRGLWRVLGDLAEAGFDAEWGCYRASDVGAPHRRDRIFILAWPVGQPPAIGPTAVRPAAARPGGGGLSLLPTPGARLGDGRGTPDPELAARRIGEQGRRNLDDAVALLPTPRTSDRNGGGAHGDGGMDLRTSIALLPTPAARDADRGAGWGDQPGRPLSETIHRLLPTPRASDGKKGGPNQRGSSGDLTLPSAVQPGRLLPTPTVGDSRTSRNATANRAAPLSTTVTTGWTLSDVAHAHRWGAYAPAISRWETILGRPAPEPTEPGRTGAPRLAPRFVEWLMGLPAGHVTAVPDLSRNAQLRLLGNGVVPFQAAAAITELVGARRAA